jgi:hypothetical protein
MKVFLMYRDQDFDAARELPPTADALTQDLEMNTLLRAMAAEDQFLYTIVEKALLSSLHNPNAIRYRQEILRDCLENEDVIRKLYQLTIETGQQQKRGWLGIFSSYPSGILNSAVQMLDLFVTQLRQLRALADEHASRFQSEGLKRFFAMLAQELDDDYFALLDAHLKTLRFRNGVLLSACLGQGNEGTNILLHRPRGDRWLWLRQLLAGATTSSGFSVHPRDEHGARALSDLRDRGLNLVANAAAQSADHIKSFFQTLRIELAFYVGCLNLREQLVRLGGPIAFPVPAACGERKHTFTGLYDVCLALTVGGRVVGSDMNADAKELILITGANQGGKSTFLRSIGLAQLMMQCGLFVPAESFSASCCNGLFTHFRREEDSSMESGKLDEELGRTSEIVSLVTKDSLVLFNESFAATNEKEGAEIASQIVSALLERGIKVFFVTHMYGFARSFYDQDRQNALFLRAERQADGTRTYRMIEGTPLQTSYGPDLYERVFGTRIQH